MEKKREPRPATQAPAKKSDSSKVILVLVILILLGGIGYLVFTNQKKEATIAAAEKQHESDSLEIVKKVKEIDSLRVSYQKLIEEKEALGLEVTDLKAKVAELDNLKHQVKNKQLTINSLRAQVNSAKENFAKMKDSTEALIRENQYLTLQKDSLEGVTRYQKDSLVNLSQKNTEYAEKVALASILHAENIKIAVFSTKGKEQKFVPIYKAKTVGKLKIAFDLAENLVAPTGDKEIYFRIIEPSGSTIFEGDKIFMLDGKEAFYTDKQTVSYNNSKQQVAFMYNKGSAYKPGKYTIELFEEGHKIGDTYLSLK